MEYGSVWTVISMIYTKTVLLKWHKATVNELIEHFKEKE